MHFHGPVSSSGSSLGIIHADPSLNGLNLQNLPADEHVFQVQIEYTDLLGKRRTRIVEYSPLSREVFKERPNVVHVTPGTCRGFSFLKRMTIEADLAVVATDTSEHHGGASYYRVIE